MPEATFEVNGREVKISEATVADVAGHEDYEFPGDEPTPPKATPKAAAPAEIEEEASPSRQRDESVRFVSPHSPRIASMARDFGYSDAEIAETSKDALEEAVYRLYKQSQAKPKTEEKIEAKEEADDPFDLSEEELKDFDPVAQKAFKQIAKLTKENNALRKQVGGVTRHLIDVENMSNTQIVDTCFKNLGADYEGIFGKESASEIDKKSAEFERRQDIVNKVLSQGINPKDPRFQKAFADAAKRKFGFAAKASVETEEAVPVKNGRITKQQWDDAALAAPTKRNDSMPEKGIVTAKRVFLQKVRELDLNGESQHYPEFED